MNCKYCQGPMCPETVISVRRTLLGLQRSRYQGAYCAGCRVSMVPGKTNGPANLHARTLQPISPKWLRPFAVPSRPSPLGSDEQPAYSA